MEIREGYKKTEVGVIPEEWELTTWENVAEGFSSGATPYRAIEKYYHGNIKWVSSGELNYDIIYDTIEHISDEARIKTNLSIHPVGTFLMAITGLEATGTRGRCGILGCEATTNQSCMAIYETNKLKIGYLFHYYIMYADFLAFKYCQGTKQQSYTAKIVKSLPIICPSFSEQTAIATALSDVDNLINSLTKLIDKKKSIKQGAMQELLTGKKRLEGFSGEWIKKMVSEFGTITTGSTPSTLNKQYWGGQIPWITPTDINKNKNIDNSDRKLTKLGFDKARKLEANTVLITCIASIGKNVVLRATGACNQQINAILPNNEYNPDFIYYLFELNKQYLVSKAGITATSIISKSEFCLIEFVVPKTIEEQTAIANILSDMDAEIEALDKKLNKYKSIKQGMMQELLTGRIRLV